MKRLYEYLGQHLEIAGAKAFWEWFMANKDGYLFIEQVHPYERKRLYKAMETALHAFHPCLSCEIRPDATNPELILSAAGDPRYFPAVYLLAESAPEFGDWRVRALKPAGTLPQELDIKGTVFYPHRGVFLPLASEKHPGVIAIRICFQDEHMATYEVLMQAGRQVLQYILGEKVAALEIGHLEVRGHEEALTFFESRPLRELPAYVREYRHS